MCQIGTMPEKSYEKKIREQAMALQLDGNTGQVAYLWSETENCVDVNEFQSQITYI